MTLRDRLIRKLATKYNTTIEDIELLVNMPFVFLKEEMATTKSGNPTFKTIRIPGFGIFYVTERRKEFLRKYYKDGIYIGDEEKRYIPRKKK